MVLLPWGGGGLDNEVAQHRSQHDVHLHVGENRSNTPPGAAAERDPREAGRFGADETLRVEPVRVGKYLRVGVQPRNADDDGIPARDNPFAELVGRRIDVATGGIDDRLGPLYFEDRRLT